MSLATVPVPEAYPVDAGDHRDNKLPEIVKKRRSAWVDRRKEQGLGHNSKGIKYTLTAEKTKVWPSDALDPPSRTCMIRVPCSETLKLIVEEVRAKYQQHNFQGGGRTPLPEGPVEFNGHKAWQTEHGMYYFVRPEGETKSGIHLKGPGLRRRAGSHFEYTEVILDIMVDIAGFLFCKSDFKYMHKNAAKAALKFFGQFVDVRQRLWAGGNHQEVQPIDFKELMKLKKEELFARVQGTMGVFKAAAEPAADDLQNDGSTKATPTLALSYAAAQAQQPPPKKRRVDGTPPPSGGGASSSASVSPPEESTEANYKALDDDDDSDAEEGILNFAKE